MERARIVGMVVGDEVPDGPLTVSAYPERSGGQDPAARTEVPGLGPFDIEVPSGTWWLEVTTGGRPGLTAWSHDPVTVAAGGVAEHVTLVVEVPEQVR